MSIEKTIETVRSHEGEISISEICDLADAYEAKEAENVRLAKEVAAINKGAKTNARVVELLNKKVIQLQSENAELREAVGHYAEPTNWTCCQPDFVHRCGREECLMTQYEGDGQGWDVAKAALEKQK